VGKICDPPSFTGGQMTNQVYRFDITAANNLGVRSPNGWGLATGKIISITPFNDIPLTGCGLIVVDSLGSTTYNGNCNFFRNWRAVNIRLRSGGQDTGGDPPPNCRCTPDSCRVDCVGAPNGFCCIDHSFSDRLLQVLQN